MVGRLKLYMTVVSAMGFVVLCLLAANVDLGRVRSSLPESAMLALVVAAPFLLIPLGRDGRGPSVQVGAPFSFALAWAPARGRPRWWWPAPAPCSTWPTTSRRTS